MSSFPAALKRTKKGLCDPCHQRLLHRKINMNPIISASNLPRLAITGLCDLPSPPHQPPHDAFFPRTYGKIIETQPKGGCVQSCLAWMRFSIHLCHHEDMFVKKRGSAFQNSIRISLTLKLEQEAIVIDGANFQSLIGLQINFMRLINAGALYGRIDSSRPTK